MSERITRKQVESLFSIFCKVNGFTESKHYNDSGMSLDYIGCYGGYVIEYNHANDNRHYISHPFGSARRSTKDMHDVLQFAVQMSHYIKEQGRVLVDVIPA